MNGPFKIGEIRPAQYFLAIGIIIGLLFSMISDGDESSSAIILQVIQWQLQVLLPLFLLIFLHTQLHKIPFFDELNPWLKLFISGLLGAAIFSPIALYIDELYAEPLKRSFNSALLHEFLNIAPPIILSWIAMNAPWLLGFQLTRTESKSTSLPPITASEASKAELRPDFYKLLPDNLHADLIYLKAELHYLKVVTQAGSALILFNLKDAIAQINPSIGVKTHRSYWVNLRYIKELTGSSRQAKLILTNSETVPVSRGQYTRVKDSLNYIE